MVSAREQKHIESVRHDPAHVRRIKNLTPAIVDAVLEKDFHMLREKSIPADMITRQAIINGIQRIAGTIDANRMDSPGSMNGYNHFVGSELPIPHALIDDDMVCLAIQCNTMDEQTWDLQTRQAMLGGNQLDKEGIRETLIQHRLSHYHHECRRLDEYVSLWLFDKATSGGWEYIEAMLDYDRQYLASRMAAMRSTREDGTDYLWDFLSANPRGQRIQEQLLDVRGGLQIQKDVLHRMYKEDGSAELLEKLFRSGAAYGREGNHWRPRSRHATQGVATAMLDGLEALQSLGPSYVAPFQWSTGRDPLSDADIEFLEQCPGFDREARKRLHRINATLLTQSLLPELSSGEAMDALAEDPRLFCDSNQPQTWIFDPAVYAKLPDPARKEICSRNEALNGSKWPATLVSEQLARDIVCFWAKDKFEDALYLLTSTRPAFPPLPQDVAKEFWEAAAENKANQSWLNDVRYTDDCFDIEFLKTLHHLPAPSVFEDSVKREIAREILARTEVDARHMAPGWTEDPVVAEAIVSKLAVQKTELSAPQMEIFLACAENGRCNPDRVRQGLAKIKDQNEKLFDASAPKSTLLDNRHTPADYAHYIELFGRGHFSKMDCTPDLVPMLAKGLASGAHHDKYLRAAMDFCDEVPRAVLALSLANDRECMLDVAGACLEHVNTTSAVYRERDSIKSMYRARQLDIRSKSLRGSPIQTKTASL